ncbi:MAG TPA: hypothetical protein VGN57_05145 [Pirellulaceae bacterium]|jgi:hypothetical protein|nr:hypothetical protein [Pirellulaceae bacterium]
MIGSSRPRFGVSPLRLSAAALAVGVAGLLSSDVQAQVTSAYPGGPYIYIPSGQPSAHPGPPIAAAWEKLGDGIVGNEPAGRAVARTPEAEARRRKEPDAGERASNLDVRFVPRGWVVVWDRLVPLTDLSRDGSLYAVHPKSNGRVRITLDGRELFRDVLFASKYERARTLLEGR